MNFYYKYYLELKNRFFLLLFTWFSVLVICYCYKETILFLLITSSNYLNLLTTTPYFIFTNVSEIFYVYLELTFFIANQAILLIGAYHGLMFLASGLYRYEYNKLQTAFQFFVASWLCSVLLLYNFLMPYTWAFFLSFQQSDSNSQFISFFFEAKIVEYLDFFTNLYYICLVNCQFLGFIILLLTNVSENLNKIKTFRKLFYFIFILFSTLTTPPDVISQVILGSTLIIIYEFMVFSKCFKRTNTVTS